MQVEDSDNRASKSVLAGESALANESASASDRLASTTRRLICALALIPIVPTVSILGVLAIGEYAGPNSIGGSFDQVRYFHLFFSLLFVTATILIWRQAVLWTLGRKWLTAIVAMIPFVQVAYAQPLWTGTGCMRNIDDDILRVGQHEIGIAFWIWISIWLWWGFEKMNERTKERSDAKRVPRVSQRARCLAASIGTIPAVFGVFLILQVGLGDLFGWSDPVVQSFTSAVTIMAVLWVLIWRRAVVWSSAVQRRTLLAALVCLVIPLTGQWIWLYPKNVTTDFFDTSLAIAPIIGWGVWMAWTIAIWPLRGDPLTDDDFGPRCLKCNYLLRGLTATRCPECGDEPTLDELWAATTGAPL